ncbi:MAG TPA: lamin tail domain-containing protein, partial [Prolixibacteraceae bacterium]|nr:lamin tail domain-containing protein [Prolixibacteraceae bacterium]
EDNSWQNPSLFATGCLVGEITTLYPADRPKISAEKGFYTNPFDATISTTITGMDIYYTLDGSNPATSVTALKAVSPVTVRIDPESLSDRGKTPGVVLRACAKKDGYDFSPVVTRTYIFVDEVKNQTSYPGHDWPSTNINGQIIDLLIDPKVTNDNRYKNTLDDALLEIPTISLVTDNKNLFDATTGIYVNAWNASGSEWERPVSLELINPDGSDGFQIDAGLRIRGGWSRNSSFRKHAFRLFFRSEYGEGKLNYPLFEKEGVSNFDKVDLRCPQNYSWSKGDWSESWYCTFNRDVFSRDLQGTMNDPYTRSRYYHLYINGLYWGLYQTQERSEARFAASYMGGNTDDYDVVKRVGNTGAIEATDGTLDSWREVWNDCLQGFTDNTNYYKIQGLDANGKRDPSLKVLVDIDNLIDYMNIIFYTGNFDAPVTSFDSNKSPNNFYAIYNRNDDKGFRFFAHDNEHTLLVDPIWPGNGVNENRVNIADIDGNMKMEVNSFEQFQPQWLHYKLSQNAEYRMRFADRAYLLYNNNGLLTPEKTAELFKKRTMEIDTAIIAESARWGDVLQGITFTKDDSWVPMVNRTLNEWFPVRSNIVINQLKEEGLYPGVNAPVYQSEQQEIATSELKFSQGSELKITNPNSSGSIKYTVDGSDPRLTGGSVSSSAAEGANEANISILQTTIVNARVFSNGNWSPIHTLKVIVDSEIEGIQITEIHYNPLGGDGLSGSEYEFLELKNRGASPVNLTGSSFVDGIKYNFNSETIINPGSFVVLASNALTFAKRYGVAPSGEYSGKLDNGGEKVTLISASGDTIVSVKYNDKSPWPTTPDSLGFSLVPAISDILANWNDGSNWRASSEIGGSPFADDGNLNILPVYVNEVLSNSEKPETDAIELYNPNKAQVNIGGWYLSDDRNTPKKWKIPAGTTIPANGYKVFYEGHDQNSVMDYSSDEFGPAFSFSSHGDEAYIFSANSSGELTGYEHGFDFGEIETSVSFGRYINSIGKEHFVAQSEVTLGKANSYPRVGPVVINQIMYHPTTGNFEFLELVNTSQYQVKLFDENSLEPWKVSGIGFNFPSKTTLAPGETVYLIESSISPEDFRYMYYLEDGVKVYNFSGSLKNEGEEITLFKSAPSYIDDNQVIIPFIRIDKVDYNDNDTWPDADGNGNVLQRTSLSVYGNDPASWKAVPQRVSINTYALADGLEGIPYSKQLVATGGTRPLTWSTVSGNLPLGISLDPVQGIVEGTPTQTGSFTITIKVEDQSGATDEANLTLYIKANTLPIAVDDTVTTLQNYAVTAHVTNNDTDADGDKAYWQLSVASGPTNGTATINKDQTITYLPSKGFSGTDELTYTVTDYKGSSQARLIITVDQEILTSSLDVRVSQSSDDAEENVESHQLYLASS